MHDAKSLKDKAPRRRKVSLALQGGGSHGAFTWGVLDRLLEDDTIEIIGVTGTSAGAMNAVCLADGLLRGGPKEARVRLRQFWEAIGKMPGIGTLLWPLSGETQAHMRIEETPAYMALEAMRRNLSPTDFNPMKFNPLRGPLLELIDFDRLRAERDFKLIVCATNVLTALRRNFYNQDVSVDAVLASACLPDLFPPVEIDGQYYWDGGFAGNPSMASLLRRLPKSDFIIVRIDPIIRKELPRTAREIHDRVTELSFNTTFFMELTALAAFLVLIEEGQLDRDRFGRFNYHCIEASSHLEKIPPSTKLNNSAAFLQFLFELGRETAEGWLARHGADIGQRSTIDLTKFIDRTAELGYKPEKVSA
jgi:NTE family protein